MTTINKSTMKLSYSGTIYITTKIGNKIISNQVFHNSGTNLLFRFFALCTAGNYAEAEKLRPTKIKLFYNNDDLSNAKSKREQGQLSNVDSRSQFITNVNILTDKTSTTLHFMIPNAYISTKGSINEIRLYAADTSEDTEELAWFWLTDSENKVFKEINITTGFNMVLDWEMSFTGKEDGGNN